MVRPPHRRRRRTSRTSAPTGENVDPTPLDHPVFAQPQPTADPTQFRLRHPSDAAAYKTIDELNAEHKLGPMPATTSIVTDFHFPALIAYLTMGIVSSKGAMGLMQITPKTYAELRLRALILTGHESGLGPKLGATSAFDIG
jgi:hypothetical protein